MQEADRMVFQHWNFDPKLPRNTFDTNPPKGYRTLAELEKEQKEKQGKDK